MSDGYSSDVAGLTPLMVAVLRCGSRGLSIGETARELHIAETTVVDVRRGARRRLEARNFVAAVYTASRRGDL